MSALEAWGRLWGEGATDSFGAGADSEPTRSPLAGLWLAEFKRLGPKDRVLDIATGAGIVPRLLQHACTHESVVCDAVDAAALPAVQRHSGYLPGHARLRFHEHVRAEQLPFDDDSFNVVTSQFGIEYADLDLAIAEAIRVLKPGGRLCMVMHHAQGRPAVLAREELGHAVWLQKESGWPDAARRMLLPLSLLYLPEQQWRIQNDPELQAIRRRYDQAVASVQQRAAASAAPDLLHDVLGWVASVFQVTVQQGQAQGEASLQRLSALVSDGALRLQDLLAHALPKSRIDALLSQLEDAGFCVSLTEAMERGHCMGWHISASKSDNPI